MQHLYVAAMGQRCARSVDYRSPVLGAIWRYAHVDARRDRYRGSGTCNMGRFARAI